MILQTQAGRFMLSWHFGILGKFLGLSALILLSAPSPASTPNDPLFNAQWHLKKINAPAAWNTTTGSKEVVVAVLDTGVDYTDPDLIPNMWRNPGESGLDLNGKDKSINGVDDDINGYIDDLHGVNTWHRNGDPMDYGFTRGALTIPYTHGTSSAGVIGATGNNGRGTAGVAWNVSILAIRLSPVDFDKDWNNPKMTASYHAAFEYLLEMKRRGVNIVACSISGGIPSYTQKLNDLVDACGAEGIITVVAAGNNGLNNDQIGGFLSNFNFRHVIVVGATLQDDTLWSGSSYGRSTVHLAAPGMNIVTTHRNDYCCTSSATPQVSGAIALLKAAYPDATADELKAAILGSVDQPAGLNGKLVTNGRLNVGKALVRITNNLAPTIVVSALPVSPRTRSNHPIQVTFSRPMDRESVQSATVFNPPVTGHFEWLNNDRTMRFIPDFPLKRTNYTASIHRSARDLLGNTLDGNYNGARQDTVADDFKWTFGVGLENDDFADATTITGTTGGQKGNTRNASPEVEEPDHVQSRLSSPSVWYRWTAPVDGWQTFDAFQGTSFDTLLAIYTGDSLGSLETVAANDNYGSRSQSRVTFEAVAGRTYSIAVASKAFEANKLIIDESRMGSFNLNWYPTPTPGFTSSGFSPLSAAPGRNVTLIGTNFTGATSVLFNGVSAAFTNAPGNNADLRIIAVVPLHATSGPINIVTPHGSVTSSTSFTVLRPQLSLLAGASGTLEITWTAGTGGVSYVLEESETMQSNSWSLVSHAPTLQDGMFKVALPVSPGQRFFRARQQ